MTLPLPGGYADELLWHLNHCPTCRTAKIFLGGGRYCARGSQLIRLTTDERHGKRTDQ